MATANKKLSFEVNFFDITSKRHLVKNMHNDFDLAQKSYKCKLNLRRNRLQSTLTSENNMNSAIVNQLQESDKTSALQERERRYFQMVKDRENANKSFVEQKRMQQHFENCDETRLFLRKQLHEQNKIFQLMQIEDKRKQAQEKEDYLNAWQEIGKKIHGQQLQNEQLKCHRWKTTEKTIQMDLEQQIRIGCMEKERICREALQEDHLQQSQIDFELKEKEQEIAAARRKEKEKLKKDLIDQRTRTAHLQKLEKQKEMKADIVLADSFQRQVVEDNKAIRIQTEANRMESVLYLDFCANIQKQRRRKEQLRNETTENDRLEVEKKQAQLERNKKALREAANQRVFSIQRNQINEQKQSELDAYQTTIQEASKEHELFKANDIVHAQANADHKTKAIDYGKELLQQVHLRAQEKSRNQIYELEVARQTAENNRRYVEKAYEFVELYHRVLPLNSNGYARRQRTHLHYR